MTSGIPSSEKIADRSAAAYKESSYLISFEAEWRATGERRLVSEVVSGQSQDDALGLWWAIASASAKYTGLAVISVNKIRTAV